MRTIRVAVTLAAIAVLCLGGCTALLPSSKTEVVSVWNSYDEAVQVLGTFKAQKTTRTDVHAAGLEPAKNPAITILHYADVMQRFATVTLQDRAGLDKGIRQCLDAGRSCYGYAVSVKKIDRDRVGNFWLDAFNFKRETSTTGWSVDALLVFVDDVLVYGLVGGQPTIKQYDVQRNPLGPLQSWGDQVIAIIR